MTGRFIGLTVQFLGLALVFSSLSFGPSGRPSAAWLAALSGTVTFLVGRRLLQALAAPRHGSGDGE